MDTKSMLVKNCVPSCTTCAKVAMMAFGGLVGFGIGYYMGWRSNRNTETAVAIGAVVAVLGFICAFIVVFEESSRGYDPVTTRLPSHAVSAYHQGGPAHGNQRFHQASAAGFVNPQMPTRVPQQQAGGFPPQVVAQASQQRHPGDLATQLAASASQPQRPGGFAAQLAAHASQPQGPGGFAAQLAARAAQQGGSGGIPPQLAAQLAARGGNPEAAIQAAYAARLAQVQAMAQAQAAGGARGQRGGSEQIGSSFDSGSLTS